MNSRSERAEFHRKRCLAFRNLGKLDAALKEIQESIRLRPNMPEAWFNLAAIRYEQKQLGEAVDGWRKAIELRPEYFQAYVSLSIALRRMARTEESITAARAAVQFGPESDLAHQALADALSAAIQFPESEAEYLKALELNPKNAAARNNFGNLLSTLERPAEAVSQLQAAFELEPARFEILGNLANIYKTQGKVDQAIESLEKVVAGKPTLLDIHSNLLLTLNSHIRVEGGLRAEHAAWGVRHAAPLLPAKPVFANVKTSDRKLRIGYVSADFRKHSVSYFFKTILQSYDHNRFETYCYSNTPHEDHVTQQISRGCDEFRPIAGVTPDAVAATIRTDAIDILVDLSGHTANHSLLVFARKPAPVQVTYLGYPNTTGVAAIDYRLTDEHADPPGMTEPQYSEQLIRLPVCFLCYGGPDEPVSHRGEHPFDPQVITFGSFNNFAKVVDSTVRIWSAVLAAVPSAYLMFKAETLADPTTRKDVQQRFADFGVDASRLILRGREPNTAKHLAVYQQIDIALDTFPYHGTTTTCEAMWMGVPTVTLAGRAHVSRVGVSLMNAVGLPELIAKDEADFVRIAKALAEDAKRLRTLQQTLRQRMLASPLCDAAAFTAKLASAYESMWRHWLAGQ